MDTQFNHSLNQMEDNAKYWFMAGVECLKRNPEFTIHEAERWIDDIIQPRRTKRSLVPEAPESK